MTRASPRLEYHPPGRREPVFHGSRVSGRAEDPGSLGDPALSRRAHRPPSMLSLASLRIAVKFLGLVGITFAAVSAPVAVRVATLNRGLAAARFGARASAVWSRLMCRVLGIRVRNAGDPGGDRFLVAANHLSYLDIWVLGSLYPGLFVAKTEIRAWPVIGWICWAAGTLFVDRNNPRDAVRVMRTMSEYLDAGIPVTVFPEGSTSRGLTVRRFQAALLEPAARQRIPCYAATLRYETPGTPDPPSETICWCDGYNVLKHVLRIMRMPRIDVEVRFSPSPFVASTRKELADRLWEDARGAFTPVRQQRRCAP